MPNSKLQKNRIFSESAFRVTGEETFDLAQFIRVVELKL